MITLYSDFFVEGGFTVKVRSSVKPIFEKCKTDFSHDMFFMRFGLEYVIDLFCVLFVPEVGVVARGCCSA